MRKLVPVFVLLSAPPTLAQDLGRDEPAAFIKSIAAQGCSVTEVEAKVLPPAFRIERTLLAATAIDLLDRNFADLSEDNQTFKVAPELCQ